MNPLWLFAIVPVTIALAILVSKIVRIERAEHRHREICKELDE